MSHYTNEFFASDAPVVGPRLIAPLLLAWARLPGYARDYYMSGFVSDLPTVAALFAMVMIVLCASIVQASLGMGYGLMSAPLLAVVDPAFVPVPTIVMGMLSSTLGAWSERQHIVWPEVCQATMGRFTGVVIAAAVMAVSVHLGYYTLVFGLLVALAVLLSAIGLRLVKSRLTLLVTGLLSGLMGTVTGVGAPPLALIYQHSPAVTTRPTLAAFFAIGCMMSVLALVGIGWVGALEIKLCLLMLLPMLLGTLIGRRYRQLVSDGYRYTLLGVAGIASLVLIVRGAGLLAEKI